MFWKWQGFWATFVALMGILSYFGLGKKDAAPVPVVAEQSAPVEERSGLLNPEQWLIDFFMGGLQAAGQNISSDTALTVSALYACVALRARTIGSMQIGLFRRKRNGDSVEVTDWPEAQAVCVEPHRLYGSYAWRHANQVRLDLHGNAYNRKIFDAAGRVEGLELLTGQVTPYLLKGKLYYQVIDAETGRQQVYLQGEILHLKGFSDNGIMGKSPLQMARESIGRSLAGADYASKIYKSGGVLRGFIENPGLLKDNQVQSLREALKTVMRDYETTGGIGVLQNNATFKPVSLSPKDVEWIGTNKVTTQDIARYYATPLHMIGELDRATFSNVEHQEIEFHTHTMRPIAKSWEDELNRELIPRSEWGKMYFRFNMASMLRGDTAARADFYTKMWNIGAMNLDEIRGLENLPQIPGGHGKKHFTPLNMSPIDAPPEPTGQQQADNAPASAGNN